MANHTDNLADLLPKLQLPWDYAVLAAILSPANGERSAYVLLNTRRPEDPQPYVVYRVDREDGSCHGGRYCEGYPRALQIFAETVCGIETAYCGSRESKAFDRGRASRDEVWLVRGGISDDAAVNGGLPADTVEWQFSDGPAGQRFSSSDFLDLEEGLRQNSGKVIHWDPSNDEVPPEYAVSTYREEDNKYCQWRGVITHVATGDQADVTAECYHTQSQALSAARQQAWEMRDCRKINEARESGK